MNWKISIFLFFVISAGNAQVVIEEIHDTNSIDKEVYVFPKIKYHHQAVADSINHFLLFNFLEIENGKFQKSIFENVWLKDTNQVIARISHISYEVLNNSKNLLSIMISAEFCGAYCEGFDMYYNFDLRTGKSITIHQLLSKEGIELFNDNLKHNLYERLDSTLIKVRQELSLVNNDEAKEELDDKIEFIKNCFYRENPPTIDHPFYLNKHEIVFILSTCSSHLNRSLDDGDYIFHYTIADKHNCFTHFALKLIK